MATIAPCPTAWHPPCCWRCRSSRSELPPHGRAALRARPEQRPRLRRKSADRGPCLKPSPSSPLAADSGLNLWSGGPVEPGRGFLLLGTDPGEGDGQRISDGFHLTASMDVLRRLLETAPEDHEPERARLLLGYAGWGPGQLDAELAASAWLTAPADPDLVFDSPPEQMWERAIRGLGVDPLALQLAPGVQ
ncbi:MAG: YqgE/AlgH family protein [Candidatus Binatia bacterium]